MMISHFKYSVTLFYNKQIGRNPFIISKIKPFIDNFDWEKIKFPSTKQDYQTFEMNNESIALNVLQEENKKINHFNRIRKNKVTLLLLTDDKK